MWIESVPKHDFSCSFTKLPSGPIAFELVIASVVSAIPTLWIRLRLTNFGRSVFCNVVGVGHSACGTMLKNFEGKESLHCIRD